MAQIQVLPPMQSRWSMLGQSLGNLGGSYLGNEVNYRRERNRLQNALNGLQPTEDMTSFDLGKQLLSATAGLQDQGKIVSTLYPLMLQQIQGQRGGGENTKEALQQIEDIAGVSAPQKMQMPSFQTNANAIGQGQTQPQAKGEGIEIPKNPEEVLSSMINTLGDQYFPNVTPPENVSAEEGKRPLKPIMPPKPIGPMQVSNMRTALSKQGIKDKSEQDNYINQIKDFQRESYESQKAGYQNIADYQQNRQAEDDRFFKATQDQLTGAYGAMAPDAKNIWKGFARLNENTGNDESRFRNTEQMFNKLVYDPLTTFDKTAPTLPYGSVFRPAEVTGRLNTAQSVVKDHLNSINENPNIPKELKGEINDYLRNQYMLKMAENDWGVAQSAYVVSNASPESLNRIPMAAPLKETLAETIYHNNDEKTKNNDVAKLANSLMKIKDDDSLILLNQKSISNNYTNQDFNDALNLAMRNGLKLSHYQRSERPKLSIPQQLDLDSVMNGKRSIFDLFKAKQ